MSGKPILELKNVGLAYNEGRLRLWGRQRNWVLKDISFTLHEGETLGVIGRNGVGKSTLLQLLAGIYTPDKGQIIRHTPGRASLLSLNTGFVPHLTGRENAILSGILLGLRRREIEALLDTILDFSELGDFFEEPLRTYSSGMRARLGFSVAYHVRPEILLIDETLGVGYENFKKKSTAAMKQRIQDDGTVILVSHSAGTIRELCDHAVWINEGVTQAQGEVEPVLKAYLADQEDRRKRNAKLAIMR